MPFIRLRLQRKTWPTETTQKACRDRQRQVTFLTKCVPTGCGAWSPNTFLPMTGKNHSNRLPGTYLSGSIGLNGIVTLSRITGASINPLAPVPFSPETSPYWVSAQSERLTQEASHANQVYISCPSCLGRCISR